MLTASDKLWLLVFTVVLLGCMSAGVCVPIIYLISPEDLPAPGHSFSFGQAALCLGGMALGLAAAVTFFGFFSRRFVSAATHQRWADYLGEKNTYVQYRAPAFAKLLRWVLIPQEHRGAQPDGMRSNNRWRGP